MVAVEVKCTGGVQDLPEKTRIIVNVFFNMKNGKILSPYVLSRMLLYHQTVIRKDLTLTDLTKRRPTTGAYDTYYSATHGKDPSLIRQGNNL